MITSQHEEHATKGNRRTLIARLHELVAALDRRVPHLEREGEQHIAHDSAGLKREAQERIAQLEAGPPR